MLDQRQGHWDDIKSRMDECHRFEQVRSSNKWGLCALGYHAKMDGVECDSCTSSGNLYNDQMQIILVAHRRDSGIVLSMVVCVLSLPGFCKV